MTRKLVVTDGVVAGNPYDKHGTKNPLARALVDGFDTGLKELLARVGPVDTVLEAGCGEGHVTDLLADTFPQARVVGRDFSPEIIEIARRGYPARTFEVESIYETAPPAPGALWDLVLACEVLEHLDDPERAVRRLASVAGSALIFTVPREPVWRVLNVARGKYLSRLGNSHGHVNHWSRRGFLAMLARHVDVIETRSPLPWTQALCRPRRGAGA